MPLTSATPEATATASPGGGPPAPPARASPGPRITLGLAAVSLAVGALAMAGWWLGIPTLTTWVTPLPAMVPATAVGLVSLGMGTALAARPRGGALRACALLGAALTLVISLGTLAAYATGSSLGPERVVMDEAVRRARIVTAFPGRMSPQTAGALVCLGVALTLCLSRSRGLRRLAQPLCLVAATLAVIAVAGHLHGVVMLFGVTSLVGMALPTAVGLLAAAGAILALDPGDGLYALLARPGPAGRHARHLALAAFAIPFGGAVLFRWGEALGLYDAAFRSAAYVASTALLLFAIACAGARSLLRADEQREQLAQERSRREIAEGVAEGLRQHAAERERAGEALRESKDEALARASQLEAVLDCIADGVVVYDREGRTVRSSPAADEILQVPLSERAAPVAGRVMRQYEVRSEDGRLLGPEEMVAVRAAVHGEDVPAAMYQVKSGDCEPRWLILSGKPLRIAGQHAGAVLSMTDVTDHRRAEERLAIVSRLYAVLSRVNEVIVRTHDERSLYADLCRIVADEGGFPLVWVGLLEGRRVVPAASAGPAADYVRTIRVEVDGELGRGPTGTCVRDGRAVINDDFASNPATQAWRAAALERHLRSSASFPLRCQGRAIGALTLYASRPGTFGRDHIDLLDALSADVSYALDAMQQERLRGEAERALRESEQALREVDERKNNFLAMLSHELRNPLAPIRNGLHLLERVPPGSVQAARAKEVLGRQVEHLTRLVDDLLDITRISHGKVELRRTVVDLRDLVQKTCADHGSVFEQRGVDLHVEVPGTSLWVDADVTRISQALRNLLVNAVKFTPEGGKVVVSASRRADRVEIDVRDDGVGLDPAALARVFEPFVQAESGYAIGKGGLGLGLALVKGFVEAHGGAVRAESEGPDRGSRFTVSLPLATPPEPARSADRRPPAAARALDILVIEDNVDGAETLAAVLELQGHRAHIATDGPSGLSRARELKPNVILCDIDLPGLSGYEIARTLKAEGGLETTRLIAVSGYARADDRRLALDAGFNAHLAKPVSVDELNALLAGKP